jgi:predicted aldo/keto reductase-like oxidoreductase
LLDLYCTGCGYCKGCPEKIEIREIFALYNNAVIGGDWEAARQNYAASAAKASACIACGACSRKCPQKLDIAGFLKKVHTALVGG